MTEIIVKGIIAVCLFAVLLEAGSVLLVYGAIYLTVKLMMEN